MKKALILQGVWDGREPRGSWKQTFHVLEIMESIERSSRAGAAVRLQSRYERCPAMADGGVRGILD